MSHFTSQQKAIIKAYILADPILSAKPMTSAANGEIAIVLNGLASPDFIVWKPSISKAEIQGDPGFDWTRVDNLSVGKARIWTEMFYSGSIDPSQANYRAGIAATWTGTTADNNVQAVVLALCKRKATIFEKLLATGAGTTVSPAAMAPKGIGAIGADHVAECRES